MHVRRMQRLAPESRIEGISDFDFLMLTDGDFCQDLFSFPSTPHIKKI